MNKERERERGERTFPASSEERRELTSGVVEHSPENDASVSERVDKE